MAKLSGKVVHVTTLHPTFDIRIFHKECRSLAEAGYDVTLIAPHERIEMVEGVRVIGLPRIHSRLLRMLVGGWRAYRLAARERARIYHFHDPELLPWMARLKRRAKVVYDVHEDLSKSVLTKAWLPKLLRGSIARLSRAAERRYSRGMQLVLAERSYEQSYDWAPAITVLNMPRVADLLAVRERKFERPTVGYFGAVNENRGSIVMIAALGKLRAEGMNIALECLGPVSARHKLELARLAKELDVDVNIRGYMPAPEGWRIMARCHAGLALLHAQPNYVDSYPTKIFEYMALGIPVIASDFPLYRELLEGNECGICVPPTDQQAIAEALRHVVSDPGKGNVMAANGRRAAELKYNWNNEGPKLVSLYSQLLGIPDS